MKTKTGMLALGVIALLAMGVPNLADADWRSRQKTLDKNAARAQGPNRAELHKDRAELHRDLAELERDRADLHRLYRNGASRSEIARKRAEINQDLAEIHQDKREIREDVGTVGRDRWESSNVYGRNDNSGSGWWGRGNSGSWDRGNDRWGRGR